MARSSSPAAASSALLKEDDDEIFFGPMCHKERCASVAVQEEEKVSELSRPLSPLSAQDVAKLFVEANKVAYHIQAYATKHNTAEHAEGMSNDQHTLPTEEPSVVNMLTEDASVGAREDSVVEDKSKMDVDVEAKVKNECSNVRSLHGGVGGMTERGEMLRNAGQRRSLLTGSGRLPAGPTHYTQNSGGHKEAAPLQRNTLLRRSFQQKGSKMAVPLSKLQGPSKSVIEVSSLTLFE